jgi:hypothetical protein
MDRAQEALRTRVPKGEGPGVPKIFDESEKYFKREIL